MYIQQVFACSQQENLDEGEVPLLCLVDVPFMAMYFFEWCIMPHDDTAE
jgi:hypothetical protein